MFLEKTGCCGAWWWGAFSNLLGRSIARGYVPSLLQCLVVGCVLKSAGQEHSRGDVFWQSWVLRCLMVGCVLQSAVVHDILSLIFTLDCFSCRSALVKCVSRVSRALSAATIPCSRTARTSSANLSKTGSPTLNRLKVSMPCQKNANDMQSATVGWNNGTLPNVHAHIIMIFLQICGRIRGWQHVPLEQVC